MAGDHGPQSWGRANALATPRLRPVSASLAVQVEGTDLATKKTRDVPKPTRLRLTDDVVECARNPAGRQMLVWDTQLPGYCLRVHPHGRKVYCVRYVQQGRARLYTIGPVGDPWSAAEARVKARDVLATVAAGRDPAAEKKAIHGGLTVAALIDRYLEEGPATKPAKRASSWRADRSCLIRHTLPLIGKLRLRHLRRADIARMVSAIMEGKSRELVRTKARGYARVTGGLGSARRVLQTTAAMFAWAIDHELMSENPAKRIALPSPPSKERYLSEAEAKRLLSTLAIMEAAGDTHPRFSDAIRLLLFTGARKTEILALKWSEVDCAGRRLVLSPERTKTGGRIGERRIPLSSAAIGVLEGINRASEWVFPAGRKMEGHTKGLQKAWEAIRKRAGLGDMRVHDLRHSFASLALAKNESILLISRVLGHTSTRMTERYVHTADRDLQRVVQRTADNLGW